MQRRSQRWSVEERDKNTSVQPNLVHPDRGEVMRGTEMLSFEEATSRVQRAAEELEGVINWVDRTSRKRSEEWRGRLNALLLTFLADRYGIAAPDSARAEIDRE